ncbi:MAG: peptidoglycan DD-metalloendopeptidase family protein [Patescibacteria group bacterium]
MIKNKKAYLFLLLISLAILSVVIFFIFQNIWKTEMKKETSLEKTDKIEETEEKYFHDKYLVTADDTFATVLEYYGFTYKQMTTILENSSSTYDFTKIKIGQNFDLVKNIDHNLLWLDYEINKDDFVRVNFVSSSPDNIFVEHKKIEYEIEIVKQTAVVSSSLYLDGLEASIPEEIIMEFTDIFAWTIDFSVQVQKNDSFAIIYEKRFRDGKESGYGNILAGSFTNVGVFYDAYIFENEEGKIAYYNSKGEAMIKQFLKAPLEFKRISSGYTYGRFHPVLQENYDHLAIDYAAPIGTPVMAVGDGTVKYAGWNGGFGNYIDIKHNDIYSTQYAHLSAYAKGIKSGVKVKQGQIIGYVGSTGWSTGPHLHYQIKKNGKLVNPLTIDLPPGEPVSEMKKNDFEKVVEKYKNQL